MCLWVVTGHTITFAAIELSDDNILSKVLGNGIAVDVFFIISAFVISLMLLRKRSSYGYYIKQRVLRLFPAYLVFLIITLLMLNSSLFVLENFPVEISKTEIREKYIKATLSSLGFHSLTHLSMLHGLVPSSLSDYPAYTLMGQAWSLTVQFQFFIVAPFLILLFKKNAFVFWGVVLGLLAAEPYVSIIMGHKSFLVGNSFMFFVGIGSAILVNAKHSGALNSRSFYLILLFMLLIAFIYQWRSDRFLAAVPILIWMVFIIVELSANHGTVKKIYNIILLNRCSRFLGDISYSMYCSRIASLYLCAFVLIRLDVHLMVFTPIMIVVPFATTLLISYLSFRFIETTFINFGKIKFRAV